jgi:hypothetical protein
MTHKGFLQVNLLENTAKIMRLRVINMWSISLFSIQYLIQDGDKLSYQNSNKFQLTSSLVGAATRTARQRLRMAGITLVSDVLHNTSRQVAQYFSIVRRNACCASFVNRSTSINTTTTNQT